MRFFLVLGCGLMAAAIAIPAAAAPSDADASSRLFMQDQQARPAPQREAPAPQRELRPPGEADRGRMNPDERRQLRRDIQDAGKDIYPRDRQPPARQQRR
jgi:hypothetical protein